MCIRDRIGAIPEEIHGVGVFQHVKRVAQEGDGRWPECPLCLLYTSDAADERSSVDLGGRRIIKNKNSEHTGR